jgi:hypothetical protein
MKGEIPQRDVLQDFNERHLHIADDWRTPNSAIPQLTIAAMNQCLPERFFRCAYQAKVMNTFDATSSSVAVTIGEAIRLFIGGRPRDQTEKD